MSLSVSAVNNKDMYYSPSTGAIIGGVTAGTVVDGLVSAPKSIFSSQVIGKIGKISERLSAEELMQIEKAMTDAIKKTGLDKKGVDVLKATTENAKEVADIFAKEMDIGLLKKLPKDIKNGIAKVLSKPIINGENACYAFSSKKIIMPEKKLSLAFFHEAGHAMNANLSKVGKILQKCRYAALLTIPIALIALWKTKKVPNEKPKNTLDKTTTFIKDNAGKLTFAAMLPILAEEGLATLKGNSLAKKLLSPELAKKVAKTNALGFTTYLLAAVLSGLGIYLGVKVKDSIASKKVATQST